MAVKVPSFKGKGNKMVGAHYHNVYAPQRADKLRGFYSTVRGNNKPTGAWTVKPPTLSKDEQAAILAARARAKRLGFI